MNERQRDAFGMVLGWLENWRMRSGTEAGRESCIRFWREQVMTKKREPWQMEQCEEVAAQKVRLRLLHEKDRELKMPGVALPHAFGRKDRRAGEKWPWQWMFPGAKPSRDPESGIVRRHHVHPDSYATALRKAVEEAMIDKRAMGLGIQLRLR